ncbi:hypothetical protein ALC56_09663 [Trachymyrmex septentrionalis]|uniref:Uncharacterized protein n=1 Tax=Trachymyrmex septentrionalis TaxID=34720 RepID=A0A195F6Q4_9HYME|nr:hypothetical protein ALC56_09663 [Trachymyrmex septentrionalis]
MSLNLDLKYYSQPNKFNSKRFPNDDKLDNSIYMPFGTKLKIIFFYLLWHYNLEPDIKINVLIMLNKKTVFIMPERDS